MVREKIWKVDFCFHLDLIFSKLLDSKKKKKKKKTENGKTSGKKKKSGKSLGILKWGVGGNPVKWSCLARPASGSLG